MVEFDELLTLLLLLVVFPFPFLFLLTIIFYWWVSPLVAYRKLNKNGFKGPPPVFPLGNLLDMKKLYAENPSSGSLSISHDMFSTTFPHFSHWQKLYGKVFVYWTGTEPFLYTADPEFLKIMSSKVIAKDWGKPPSIRKYIKPMFGYGLTLNEGDNWFHRRQIVTPALSPLSVKSMTTMMMELGYEMVHRWTSLIDSGTTEIDIEKEMTRTAGDIIARTSFGVTTTESSDEIFALLRLLQSTLFNGGSLAGVPFSRVMCLKQTLETERLGKEVDKLSLSLIKEKQKQIGKYPQRDLLGILLEKGTLTTRELMDECKSFFFAGHETTALALTWALFLLAENPKWQTLLREEIKELVGDGDLNFNLHMLNGLKKMEWVMNESLRLYPPAPNVLRRANHDIKAADRTIPKGTNIWIDIMAMHHDPTLWGEDVFEFKPERFRNDSLYGGCNHSMGFLPFGFGGRMCVGRNLTFVEFKVIMTLVLSKFSFSIPSTYLHQPCTMLSLRPSFGLPLIIQPLN